MASCEIPTKSSNEILTELFGVFNAEPPKIKLKRKRESSSEEKNSKHSKKVKKSKNDKSKKKHKHKHKHKKHKKKRSEGENEGESDSVKVSNDDEVSEGTKSSGPVNIELPVDKVPMALEIMLDGTVGIKGEDGVITEIPDVCDSSLKDSENKVVDSEKSVNGIVSTELSNEKESSQEKRDDNKTDEDVSKTQVSEEVEKKQSENGDKQKKAKIQIKDLKFSTVYQETIKAVEEEKKKKEQKKADIEEGEVVESSDDEGKADGENHSGHKQSKHRHRHSRNHHKSDNSEHHRRRRRKNSKVKETSRSRSRSPHRSHSKHYSHHYSSHKRLRSRSRERYSNNRSRDGYRRHSPPHYSSSGWPRYNNDRYRSRYYKSRSLDRRSRGRSKERSKSVENTTVEKIDKEKLLEIARKNALKLIGKGIVPGGEDKLPSIKAGGKTVNELTAYCKKLSEKEALGDDLSDIASDSSEDEDKPFHHPFRVRDRKSAIVMNIKNSIPIPIKTLQEKAAEQAKLLRLQFPVSSGTSHRRSENEWVPVSPKKDQVAQPPPPLPPPVAEISVPPMPAPTYVPQPVPPPVLPVCNTSAPPPPLLPVKPVPPPEPRPLMQTIVPAPPMFIPSIPPPEIPRPVLPPPVVRPEPPAVKVDISAVVAKRIDAIRKLQENPNDSEAQQQMYSAQQEMQYWAESKHETGAFTGSTGARVLSASELSSGVQAWAKRDQLSNATPVSGGMGMAMLQKMGWQPGEGLGKNKEGTLEPLSLEIKMDKKGLLAPDEFKKNKNKTTNQPKAPVPNVKGIEGKHPVSLLTELCSRRRYGVPIFELCFECGPDHKKNFLFKVKVDGIDYTPTVASPNKKLAKAEAAALCLRSLGIIPEKPPEENEAPSENKCDSK